MNRVKFDAGDAFSTPALRQTPIARARSHLHATVAGVSHELRSNSRDRRDVSRRRAVHGSLRHASRFPSFGESAAYAEYVAAPASDLARKPVGPTLPHVRSRRSEVPTSGPDAGCARLARQVHRRIPALNVPVVKQRGACLLIFAASRQLTERATQRSGQAAADTTRGSRRCG